MVRPTLNQSFHLSWSQNAAPACTVQGWPALAAATGLKVSSLRTLFSAGRGRITRPTATGAMVLIVKLPPPPKPPAAPKRPVGRPPKVSLEQPAFTPVDWRAVQARHKPRQPK